MRHLISLSVFSAILFLFSDCSKNEEAPPSIVGEWVWFSSTYQNCSTPDETDANGCADAECDTYIFTAEGIVINDYYGDISSGTYVIDGNKLTLTFGSTDFTVLMELTSDKLTITTEEPDALGCDVKTILNRVEN
ncbi:MAG: lipocalin family protein [Cytophagales bacterium]|nr:lipocalin family protein [Cytophagales bacterium]